MSVKFILAKVLSALTIFQGQHEHALEKMPMLYLTPGSEKDRAPADQGSETSVATYMGATDARQQEKEDLGISFLENWSVMTLHEQHGTGGLRKTYLYGQDWFLLCYHAQGGAKRKVLHKGQFAEGRRYLDTTTLVDQEYTGGTKDGKRDGFGTWSGRDKTTGVRHKKEGQWVQDKLEGIAKVHEDEGEKFAMIAMFSADQIVDESFDFVSFTF